ncbi:hypothetical protein JOC49_000435 [Fusibacter tunisiensis]|uniref:Uncharacterized protein n=2 Tax=Fusibacter tunisiensis TaxID=1008308 RepID=A0ABS2MNF6_9FIRM|nr:hypothetical protein [Fusibacter tunisiensis]
MRHEIKKVCKIVDELTTLFLKEDTNEIDFKIITEKERSVIRIIDYNTHFDPEYIEHLCAMFNRQRQSEIEEYYWQLAGEADEDDELTLISAMIDSAKAEVRGGNLYMELIRLNR